MTEATEHTHTQAIMNFVLMLKFILNISVMSQQIILKINLMEELTIYGIIQWVFLKHINGIVLPVQKEKRNTQNQPLNGCLYQYLTVLLVKVQVKFADFLEVIFLCSTTLKSDEDCAKDKLKANVAHEYLWNNLK